MPKINFTKMVASGNDFIILRPLGSPAPGLRELARKICDRKYGIGADGMLLLEKSKRADIRMRIFNADGSEAEMCGNGARCAALYANSLPDRHAGKLPISNSQLEIETKAGIIAAKVHGDNVKIKLTDPKDLKLNIPIKVNSRLLRVNFINTGVPHAVIFSEGLDEMDVFNLGRAIRFHKRFNPTGTNVDFVEISGRNSLAIRTYERGVEDETLACGTGSVAAALITSCQLSTLNCQQFNVHTKSKEILKVYFDKINNGFKNVWLEGRAKIVYKGEYYSNEGRTYRAKRT